MKVCVCTHCWTSELGSSGWWSFSIVLCFGRNFLWVNEWQFQGSELSSMICTGAVFQPLMVVMCCFRVWLPAGPGLSFTLLHHHIHHHSPSQPHTHTERHKNTHIVFAYELSRYYACILWAAGKTGVCFFLFLKGENEIAAVYYSDETLGPQPGT